MNLNFLKIVLHNLQILSERGLGMKAGRLQLQTFSWGERIFDVCNVASLLALCGLVLYPFWYVLVLSLNDGADAAKGPIWFWPREFTTINYTYVFNNPLITDAFVVTISRSIIGALFGVAVMTLVAYALSKRDIPGRKAIIYFFMIPMFIAGSVISNYVVIVKLGLLNHFLVYILPGAFVFLYMIIIRTFIEQLPIDLEESAMMDGAGYMQIFLRIILPLSKAILAAMLFFGVVTHWLDFGANLLYVTDRSLFVLQYVLYMVVLSNQSSDMLEIMQASGRLPQHVGNRLPTPQVLKMSTLIVVTMPLLFVYPFFQRYFVKGMMIGAVKA